MLPFANPWSIDKRHLTERKKEERDKWHDTSCSLFKLTWFHLKKHAVVTKIANFQA